MSEQASPVAVAESTSTTPVQAPEQAAAAELVRRMSEEQEAGAREQAEAVRAEAVKAFRRGEREYRKGLLEAGRLCHQYLTLRLKLGDQRAAAVKALEGALDAWSSRPVNVNVLIKTYWGWRLLAEEPGVKAETPYGQLEEAWSQLATRVNKDTPEEAYVLLPGLEDKCRAAFAHAAKNALGRDAAAEAVKALLAEQGERDRAAAKAEADRKRAEREEAERRRLAEQAKLDRAAAAREQAERRGTPEEAKKALAEQEARRQALAWADAEAQAKRKAQEQAERQEKRHDERAEKREARHEKAKRRRERPCRQDNPLKAEQASDPFALAVQTVEMIERHESPAKLLGAILDRVSSRRELRAKVGVSLGKVLGLIREALDCPNVKQLDEAIRALGGIKLPPAKPLSGGLGRAA